MGEQVERILFQLEVQDIDVDKSVDDLRRRFDLLKKATQALDREAKALQKSLAKEDRTIDDAVKATKKLNTEQKKSVDIQKDLKRGIDATADARKESADTARLFGDVESRLLAGGGAAGRLGGAAGAQFETGAQGVGEILATVEAVGLLKQELPDLISRFSQMRGELLAMGVAGGVLALATLGINAYNKAQQRSKEILEAVKQRVTEYTNTLVDLNTFLQGANDESIQARIQQRENQIAGVEATTKALEDEIKKQQEIQRAAIEDSRLTGEETVAFAEAGFRIKILGDNVKELADDTEAYQFEIDVLNDATVNATVAEKELAEARTKSVEQIIAEANKEAQEIIRLRRLASEGTVDQVEREIDKVSDARDIEIEAQRLLSQELAEGNITFREWLIAVADTVISIGDLNDQIEDLESGTLLLAEARAKEAATLKLLETNIDLTRSAYEDAIKSQADFAGALDEANAEKLQAEQDFADKTVEIESKRQLDIIQDAEKAALDRTNDLADHYKDLADLDRDFFEERGDLLDDISADIAAVDDEKLSALKEFNKVEIQSTVDHLKRLEAIRLKSQNSIRSASARLDALGIFEAKQAAEEELKTENDKFAEEKKRRNEDFRDQVQQIAKERGETLRAGQQALRDLQQKHNRERQATIAAFNEKLRREDQQAALERNQQQQRWAHEDQQRQSQFEKEAMARAEHLSLLLTLTSNGLFQIELAYQAWLDSVALRTGATLQTPVGVSGTTSAGTGNLPAFSSPAAITNGPQGVSNFRQPNAATSPTGPGALGGITIPISINGAQQPIEVAAEVRRELDNVFAGMVA